MDQQLGNGAWPSYATKADGILNTMAAILAINMHHRNPEYYIKENPKDRQSNEDLDGHIVRGRNALETMLQHWDVKSAVHPGFELLVPKLLRILDHEGFPFSGFTGHDDLMQLHYAKLRELGVSTVDEALSNKTVLWNLEAFIGLADPEFFGDFTADQVAHHLTPHGSMMGSPAATAAYSLYDRTNDPLVYSHLQRAYGLGTFDPNVHGGISPMFPASLRIPALVVTTLLGAGYSPQDLDDDICLQMVTHILGHVYTHSGTIGFGETA